VALRYPVVVEYESYPSLFHYDFNGDGKVDLVFQKQTTNQIVSWSLKGTKVTGGIAVPNQRWFS